MQDDIESKLQEVKKLLHYCTDAQTRKEVQEDLLFMSRYIPSPSIDFVEGLEKRLLKARRKK